jgi:hypothetical protein
MKTLVSPLTALGIVNALYHLQCVGASGLFCGYMTRADEEFFARFLIG